MELRFCALCSTELGNAPIGKSCERSGYAEFLYQTTRDISGLCLIVFPSSDAGFARDSKGETRDIRAPEGCNYNRLFSRLSEVHSWNVANK